MHLVIYFCGTGNDGDSFPKQYDYVKKEAGVRTIFVKGCDAPEVCNSGLFPDLKGFAKRFASTLFTSKGNDLTLKAGKTPVKEKNASDHKKKKATELTENEILESLGIRLDRTDIGTKDKQEKIESITLCGYSRGAVTCFEMARALHAINPKIPVDIVANQPVPGNAYQGPLTNAKSIADCSDLSNLRNVSVILGAYTGELVHVNLQTKKQLPSSLHAYKNTYLLIGDPLYKATNISSDRKEFNSNAVLYYVDSQGTAREVPFNKDYKLGSVLNSLDIHPTKEKKYSISPNRFKWLTQEKIEEKALSYETSRLVHRGFFSQILPRLPRKAHRDLIVIPRESHHQLRMNAPDGDEHMHLQMARYLNSNSGELGLVRAGSIKIKEEEARKTYSHHDTESANLFPVASQMQSLFGLKKEMAYRYIDKLHPNRLARKGMEWHSSETLYQWWQRHDKKASPFSTPLTKELVAMLEKAGNQSRNTLLHEKDTLLTLLRESERWLVLKANTATSRYYQVESLRAHVVDALKAIGVNEREIADLNRQILHETGYFFKHWCEGSEAASWSKTKETLELDKAFQEHSRKKPSKENDDALLKAMDNWLNIKEKATSKSRRYELVLEMYEELSEVIASCPYKQSSDTQFDISQWVKYS